MVYLSISYRTVSKYRLSEIIRISTTFRYGFRYRYRYDNIETFDTIYNTRNQTHGTEWNSPCGRVVAIASAVGGESELCCWSGGVGRLACVGGLTFLPLFPCSQPSRHQGSIASTSSRVLTYDDLTICLLYTSPSPRDGLLSRMPSSA